MLCPSDEVEHGGNELAQPIDVSASVQTATRHNQQKLILRVRGPADRHATAVVDDAVDCNGNVGPAVALVPKALGCRASCGLRRHGDLDDNALCVRNTITGNVTQAITAVEENRDYLPGRRNEIIV